jgi:putative transposase
MKHVRGAPMHLLPGRRLHAIAERAQTQGIIPFRGLKTNRCRAAERWHQTLKNRILLENYFFEAELEAAIAAFIDHYNNHRYHESIGNLTRLTSTSGAAKPSWLKVGASNTKPSKTAD